VTLNASSISGSSSPVEDVQIWFQNDSDDWNNASADYGTVDPGAIVVDALGDDNVTTVEVYVSAETSKESEDIRFTAENATTEELIGIIDVNVQAVAEGRVTGAAVISAGGDAFIGEDLSGEFVQDGGDLKSVQGLLNTNSAEQLEGEISRDQTVGVYTHNGSLDGTHRLNVRDATISTFDVENVNGADVAGGTLVNLNDSATTGFVNVTYNFNESEPVEVTVTDADGLDVTTEFITGATVDDAAVGGDSDKASFQIADDVSTGTYTVTVAGNDDLDFGDASVSATVEVVDDADVTVSLQPDEVVQGNSAQFSLSGGSEDDYHLVTIAAGDFRDIWSDEFDSEVMASAPRSSVTSPMSPTPATSTTRTPVG
jgi:hypothetical protein